MKRRCQVRSYYVIVSFLTPLVAPLHDSSSLERRKNLRLHSQRAAQTDTKVLYSNFTTINLHHCEGGQPEGKEMGSDLGSQLLFSPFFIPSYPSLFMVSLAGRWAYTETRFSTTGALKSLFTFLQSPMFTCTFSPCQDHTSFSSSSHCVLCDINISASISLRKLQWQGHCSSERKGNTHSFKNRIYCSKYTKNSKYFFCQQPACAHTHALRSTKWCSDCNRRGKKKEKRAAKESQEATDPLQPIRDRRGVSPANLTSHLIMASKPVESASGQSQS